MNKIVKIIVTMLCIVGFSLNIHAQSPSPAIPVAITPIVALSSPDALRNYALSKVVRGSVWYYSRSIDWNYTNTSTGTNIDYSTNGAERILNDLMGFRYNIRRINTNDPFEGYNYLQDSELNTLFYGYTRFEVGEKPNFNIWMQDVPMFDGVKNSEVLFLNEDGETVTFQHLYVKNGHVMMRPWLAGVPNGILAVHMQDGSSWSMVLSNPAPHIVNPETGDGSASYNIQGHYVANTNNTNIRIVELYNRPTVYLETPGGVYFNFDVTGVYQNESGNVVQERPTALLIDWPNGSVTEITLNNGPTQVNLPRGNHRIRFKWEHFGQPGAVYWGGGVGKGGL